MIDAVSAGLKGRAPRPASNPPLSGPDSGLVVHVGFSTTGGLLSRLIRFFTRSRISHCIVVYGCGVFAQDMVLEASGHGYRILSWRRWDKANRLIALYRLELPVENIRAGLHLLADRLGDAFDKLSLFGFFLQRVLGLKGVPFNSRQKLVCSEALALFLQRCGVPIEDVGVVTPQDAFALVEHHKDIFILVEKTDAFPLAARQLARRQRRHRSGLPAPS